VSRADAGAHWVALLHSIVLGPGRRVVMSELRDMAENLGLERPRTLVATGNLVFEAAGAEARALERRLEPAFAARFGRHIDIVVRSAEGWRRLVAGNPFREAAEAAPTRVHVRVMRDPLDPAVAARLTGHAAEGERLAVVEGDLWLHLPRGVAASRLVAAVTPARAGIGTFRNWNTVRRLGTMLDG
jgi:uncharacterized protein (DUF1697 family)